MIKNGGKGRFYYFGDSGKQRKMEGGGSAVDHARINKIERCACNYKKISGVVV